MPPHLHLGLLDTAVIVWFVAAIFALGFSAKLRNNTVLQYLAAGRELSLPAFVATLVSTWYGGVLAIGDSVKAFGLGTILLLGVPYYIFALIYALVFARRVRGAEQISIPERLALRWGKSVGLLGALLVFMLAVPAAHVLMLGVMAQLLTGWTLPVALIAGTFGGTLFLYRGGLLADVRVGLLAFAMMYIGFMIIAAWCLVHYPPREMLSTLDPSLLKWDGGGGLLLFLSYFILGAWTLVDPGFHQRVSSAASPELGRKGVLISIGFWVLFDLLSTTAGLYALAILKPSAEASGLTFFPELADRVLPPGLRAIFLCGVLGTVLSAMVGYTLVAGATFGREIVARAKGGMADSQVKVWTRVGFVLSCVIAVALALTVKNVAVDLWYAYSGAVVGALLVPVTLAYLPGLGSQARSKWVFVAMGLAFLTSFAWLIYGKRTGNDYLEVYLAGRKFTLGTLIPGLLVSAAIIGLGEVVSRRGMPNGG